LPLGRLAITVTEDVVAEVDVGLADAGGQLIDSGRQVTQGIEEGASSLRCSFPT
jgi:hypothetical protein